MDYEEIELNYGNSVLGEIIELVERLEQNQIPIDKLAYRISNDEAKVLGAEMLKFGSFSHSSDDDSLETALKFGYVHRLLNGSKILGMHIIVNTKENR
jgi:hypothetical protein